MPESFDVIVVGAGGAGAVATKVLVDMGLRVALVEAGPKDPLRRKPIDPSRQPIQRRATGYSKESSALFVDDLDHPYRTPAEKPFSWLRGRQVGGRMWLWAKQAKRMTDREFRAAELDGVGIPWPIRHADLERHYERVEALLEVFDSNGRGPGKGSDDRASRPTPQAEAVISAVRRRWPELTIRPSRMAGETGVPWLSRLPESAFTLFTDAVVSSVDPEPGGARVRGVTFIRRENGERVSLRARAVALCASTIETVRLLLSSRSADHPHGIGNAHGLLGRYLMDHTWGIRVRGNTPVRAGTGAQVLHIPPFRNQERRDAEYLRAFGIDIFCFGDTSRFPWNLNFFSQGEVLPAHENYVRLAEDLHDAFGLPAVEISLSYGENERAMARDALALTKQMAEESEMRLVSVVSSFSEPGASIHEVGGARMGSEPANSVVDPAHRVWGIDNLCVLDGAVFPSSGSQNPTLTILALASRGATLLGERLVG